MKMRSSTALLGIPDLPEEAFKHVGDRKIKPQGDSGGGGGQPSTTTQTTELPEWARPYAKNLLAKGSALTDINQNPYQQYGGNRIAGFSPMQMQSFQNAGNMDAGPQGFQQQVGQYMSPYMQNVVDVEKRGAIRDYQIGNTMQQAQATQAGAFGGGREALQRAERERGLMGTLGTIQAQGSQAAYDQASNQFRQGIQQNLAVNQLQNQYGGQMQQQAQRPLDMAYQDFQNQQNYPYKQLGFMSDLVRGLPLGQKSTSAVYDQGPGMVQTLAGLGGAAYGFGKSGLFGAKEGGLMDSYAYGGVTSQDNKDRIVDDMYSMEGLQKAKEAALARHDVDTANAIDERVAELNALQAQNASIDRGLGSAFDQIPQDQQEQMMAGGGIVAFAPGGATYLDKAEEARKQQMDYIGQATTQPAAEEQKANILAQKEVMKDLYEPNVTPKYLEEIKAERAALPEKMESEKGLAFAMASLKLLSRKRTPGESQGNQLISGLGEAGEAFAGEIGRLKKEHKEADRLLRQSEIQLATANQLYNNGMVDKAMARADQAQAAKAKAAELYAGVAGDTSKMYAQLENTKLGKEATVEAAKIHAGASERSARIAAAKETDLARQTRIRYESLLEQGKPANKQTMAEAATLAASDVGRYPGEAKAAAAAGERDAKFEVRVDKALENNMPYLKAVQKGNTEEAARIRKMVAEELKGAASQDTPAPNVPGGTGTPSRGGPQPAPAAIPPQAVDILKKNPSPQNIQYFDQTFGQGAAARALGK